MSSSSKIDPRDFRNVLGAFPTGVTVITAKDDEDKRYGVTANSFNSVSLDPPLILWSIGKTSTSYDAFMAAEFWNVHILAADQEAISNNFAKSGGDKYADIDYQDGIEGAPLIAGCAAVMQCKTEYQYEGGDHIILVGRVLDYQYDDKESLVFSRGRYAALAKS